MALDGKRLTALHGRMTGEKNVNEDSNFRAQILIRCRVVISGRLHGVAKGVVRLSNWTEQYCYRLM